MAIPAIGKRMARLIQRLALTITCFTSACFTTATFAQTPSIGIVSDIAGRVSGTGPVALLTDIKADNRIQMEPGSKLVVIYLASGMEYTFTGPAQIRFAADEPKVLSGAAPQKKASLNGKGAGLEIKPTHVRQAAFVMRGGRPTAQIKLLSPSGVRTLDAAPEFRWQELGAGLTYRFELTDDTGKALYSAEAAITSLTLPASMKLREGASYTWEVSARTADGRRYVSSGDFSVATADLRTEVERLRPGAGATTSERVAYAAWLMQQQLKDEARKVWQALAAERPDEAQLKALATD